MLMEGDRLEPSDAIPDTGVSFDRIQVEDLPKVATFWRKSEAQWAEEKIAAQWTASKRQRGEWVGGKYLQQILLQKVGQTKAAPEKPQKQNEV